jgi:rare lipoprotein A
LKSAWRKEAQLLFIAGRGAIAVALAALLAVPGAAREPATQTGLASFYGKQFHGEETASGETYDMSELVAAHPSYPFGTRLRVTNLKNERQVVVRVVDRGPADKHQAEGVIIDLSTAAAARLDFIERGRVPVRIEVLERGDGERVSGDGPE